MSNNRFALQSEATNSMHKNNFTSSKQINKAKVGSNERQYHSNTAVRLGQYVRQREFSKEKQIYGQIKSSQLVGDDDPATKQIKFKRDNINALFDKISTQISKKRVDLRNKSFDELQKQQSFMQEILNIIVGTKTVDLYGKRTLSTQISTISTAPNISSKYLNNVYFDKSQRYNTQIQLDSKKYTNTQKILDQIRLKDDKTSNIISSYTKRFQNRLGSAQKLSKKPDTVTRLKDIDCKMPQSIQNLRTMIPPHAPKK